MNDRGASPDEIDALADRIAESAASIDAAIHRLLTDLRRFDLVQGWERQGALSLAHWLGWRCGISLGASREKVRVAHALAELPRIDEALRLGQVSYSKVRAMTRVATASNEEQLLALARSSTAAQLEKICRLAGQLAPGRERAPEPQRWVHVRTTDDGMTRIELQLRADEATRLLQAADVSAETRPDGFVALAEAALRGDRPDRPPTEVLLHIDAGTLQGHTGDAGVSAETSRRLLCDAGVVPILEDVEGKPLDVGRKTRTISSALRRALLARDGGCGFPGCGRARWVDAHHIEHWASGGETSLANTVLLCTRHHTLVHEGGFGVAREGDELRFLDPRGHEVPSAGCVTAEPPPIVVPPRPGWDGDPVDYDAAVESLA
jgi:hypothetical protein